MDGIVVASGVQWGHPMLHVRRADLRTYLQAKGVDWIDDPSNEDPNFDRVRVRKALGTLDELGIDVPKIEKTTRRLKSAKQVLYVATKDLGHAICELSWFGAMSIDAAALMGAQPAIQLRLLSEAVRFVAGSYYAPRAYSVQAVLDALPGDMMTRSLHGCLIWAKAGVLHLRREPEACEGAVRGGAVWDGRWQVTGPFSDDMCVKMLGEDGLAARPNWREADVMRAILLTTPAIWQGETLISAPLLDSDSAFEAEICLRNDFFAS